MKPRSDSENWGQFVTTNRGGEQGFTLLETCIAFVVIMVATLGVAGLFTYAITYNSGATDRALALAIAQQRMERLRKAPVTDSSLTTGITSETVTNASHSFQVVTTICDTSGCGGTPTLKMIIVQVTPLGAAQWASAPVTAVSQRAWPSLGAYAKY
jgi:Tfp pilus assembly protein PilV